MYLVTALVPSETACLANSLVERASEAISVYTPTLIRLGYNLNPNNDSFRNSSDDLFK